MRKRIRRFIRQYCHWQNLNERNGITGSILKHGRCWIRRSYEGHSPVLGIEWVLFSKDISFGIGLACRESALSFHIGFLVATLYFNLEYWPLQQWLSNKIKRKDEKYGNGRMIGFYYFHDAFWFKLWEDEMESRGNDPKWWKFCFHWKDFLFGREECSKRKISETFSNVAMLERNYPIKVEFWEWTWKRPRWPFPLKLIRYDITPDIPVPVPGKGENSWDCGEDAIHSMTGCGSTLEDAVIGFSKSIMRDRHRYGGNNWMPEDTPIANG